MKGDYYSYLCALIVYSVQVLNPTMTKSVCVCVWRGRGAVRVEGAWKSLTGIVVGEEQLFCCAVGDLTSICSEVTPLP